MIEVQLQTSAEVAKYELPLLNSHVAFAKFLDDHPKDYTRARWIETLKRHLQTCYESYCQNRHCRLMQESTNSTQPQEEQKDIARIVCRVDYKHQTWSRDQVDCTDLFALPLDILCCRATTKPEDLEPAYPIEKIVKRNDSPLQTIWTEFEDRDKVVIISYSTNQQDYVEAEARFVRDQFSYVLNVDQVLEIRDEPPEHRPLRRREYQEKIKDARIIWMHNLSKGKIDNYLADLPSDCSLVLHYIGPIDRDALVPPRPAHGGRIDSLDFKRALDLPSRIIKLFYISPRRHSSDRREVFLRSGMGGFVYEIVREAPKLADMVWFRWSLIEEVAKHIAEEFYFDLVRDSHDTAQALLQARKMAYKKWNSRPDCYYAWAAPILITQRLPSDREPEPPVPPVRNMKEIIKEELDVMHAILKLYQENEQVWPRLSQALQKAKKCFSDLSAGDSEQIRSIIWEEFKEVRKEFEYLLNNLG